MSAKQEDDNRDAVRSLGRSFGELKTLLKLLQGDRCLVAGEFPTVERRGLEGHRNIAVFIVCDGGSRTVYDQFAVSGNAQTISHLYGHFGAPLALKKQDSFFTATEALGMNGEIYDRHSDSEFKLLNAFAATFPNRNFF